MKTAILALAALTLAAPAFAQSDWDQDGDGALNPEEFVVGFSSLGTFDSFDVDGSGRLDESEWSTGLAPVGEYADMDLNGDGGVDEAEYNALLFNRYDADGSGAVETAEMAALDADTASGGMLGG